MLEQLSRRLARREATTTQRAILARLRARIQVEVMRRAVRMVLHCLPHHDWDVEGGPRPSEDQPVSAEAEARAEVRAGHPGLCHLPPFSPPPSRWEGGRPS